MGAKENRRMVGSGPVHPLNQEKTTRLQSELQVHRLELERQNEELRLARAEVEAGLQKYYELYDFAPIGYCTVDRNGLVRESNLAGALLLGMDRSRLLHRNMGDLVSADSRSQWASFFERLFAGGDKASGEIRTSDNQRSLYLEGAAFEAASGEPLCRVAMMDVTASRQASVELEHYRYHLEELVQQRTSQLEEANVQLREQAENLASIYQALDSIGLIVCTLEEDDARIDIFSAGAEKLFGWRQDQVLGQSVALIYPLENRGLVADQVRRLRAGQTMQSFDLTLTRRTGERFPAVVSVHPFARQDGRYTKVVGGFRDISELMLVQDQLQAMNDELERRVEQRTRELQETQKQVLHAEKLSAVGKLSASIAHEFNNPLQGIQSVLKGLKKRAVMDEEDRLLLDAAIGESERIKELIRHLQDFNRPTSDRKTLMDVHQSLNAMLLLHKSDFRNKRIRVDLNYADRLPNVLAAPDQIKQVFLNLLANAADACPPVGGVITVTTGVIGGRVSVSVADNGVGIASDHLDLIFQPFFTTKPEVKGTGLGLSVCYGIVKNHQGEIRVSSQPNEGATFTVLLPVETRYVARPDIEQ
jgi:PAS domain S-box-containing protein